MRGTSLHHAFKPIDSMLDVLIPTEMRRVPWSTYSLFFILRIALVSPGANPACVS